MRIESYSKNDIFEIKGVYNEDASVLNKGAEI